MDSVVPVDSRLNTLIIQLQRVATSAGALDLLPEACARLLGYQTQMIVDEPVRALQSLAIVFQEGNQKHGMYDWKRLHADSFIIKGDRHLHQRMKLKQKIDESGQPHLVHAACDLLLAAELEWAK